MKGWTRGQTVWALLGALVVFVVVFQVVESLVTRDPATDAVGRAVEPAREPEPIRLEVTRVDERTVQIQVGSDETRIGIESGRPDDVEILFACLNDGIDRALRHDPSLTAGVEGRGPGAWLARQVHEGRLSDEVDRVKQDCLNDLMQRRAEGERPGTAPREP